MKKIQYEFILLSTEKESVLYKWEGKLRFGDLTTAPLNLGMENKNLYLISNETVKKSDWVIVDDNVFQILEINERTGVARSKNFSHIADACKKIILALDSKINNTDDYILGVDKLPIDLVKEFIIRYNENKTLSIENFYSKLPSIIRNSTYGTFPAISIQRNQCFKFYDKNEAEIITNKAKEVLNETLLFFDSLYPNQKISKLVTDNLNNEIGKIKESKLFYELKEVLFKERNFNPNLYLHEKAKLINKFFTENKLDSCILGISGGIDSAVVYKLLEFASQQESSPIKLIQPLFLPIYSNGITGQHKARLYANLLVGTDKLIARDLTRISEFYGGFYNDISDWTQGQIDSIIRTPALYGEAAYLQQKGYKSIVIGTTNLSECGYIGFYGKASDFCNDLQPISDLYKSEVYELAELLSVPKQIIERNPTGDTFDSSTDEQTIGCPYWFLELYTLFKHNFKFGNNKLQDKLLNIVTNLSLEESNLWKKYTKSIESIRNKNLHKYGVGNGAYHLNVMEQIIFKK